MRRLLTLGDWARNRLVPDDQEPVLREWLSRGLVRRADILQPPLYPDRRYRLFVVTDEFYWQARGLHGEFSRIKSWQMVDTTELPPTFQDQRVAYRRHLKALGLYPEPRV